MNDLKSSEYKILRDEIQFNRKFIFERALILAGGLLAAKAFFKAEGLFLDLLMVMILFLLFFNLWFTINRLRTNGRIIGYLRLFHEGEFKERWEGWENSLNKYRIWNAVNKTKSREIRESKTYTPKFDSGTFYSQIFLVHILIMIMVSFALIVLDGNSNLVNIHSLSNSSWVLKTSYAFVCVVVISYAIYTLKPTKISNIIAAETEIWKTVENEMGKNLKTKQATLVSFYKQKSNDLKRSILECLKNIEESKLSKIVKPYNIEQIHGTIIGVEKLPGFKNPINSNIWYDLERKAQMEFSHLKEIVSDHFPMTIRFGGFDKSFRSFKSFGKIPYQRTFQIQWETGKIILVGWPHDNNDFSNKALYELRKEIEDKCKIRHKYAKYNDNDLFIVLGDLTDLETFSSKELKKLKKESADLEEVVRQYFSNNSFDVEIKLKDICIAKYTCQALPVESTTTYSLIKENFDSSLIKNLYLND